MELYYDVRRAMRLKGSMIKKVQHIPWIIAHEFS